MNPLAKVRLDPSCSLLISHLWGTAERGGEDWSTVVDLKGYYQALKAKYIERKIWWWLRCNWWITTRRIVYDHQKQLPTNIKKNK